MSRDEALRALEKKWRNASRFSRSTIFTSPLRAQAEAFKSAADELAAILSARQAVASVVLADDLWRAMDAATDPADFLARAIAMLQQRTHNMAMVDNTVMLRATASEQAPVAVPEGWALVPQKMAISPEGLAQIEFMCGGPDLISTTQDGDRWLDGILWVGETEGDNGEKYWGLNIACVDLLDEGSIPVCEFDRPTSPAQTSEAMDAARYRWMRRGLANTKLLPDGVADLFANALDQNDATKFDEAIDTAMRQEAGDE